MPRKKKDVPNPYDDMNPNSGGEKEEPPKEEEIDSRDLPPMSKVEAEKVYRESSTEFPARDIDLPEPVKIVDDGDGEHSGAGLPMTMAQAANEASDMTDMQYIAHRLFPTKIKTRDEIDQMSMVARIDPNIFLPQIQLNSEDEIMCSDPMKPIDVNLVYQKHYNILSKGLDGMGIIDLLELGGAAREEKRAEKMFGGGLGAG